MLQFDHVWVAIADVALTIIGMVGTAFFYTIKVSKIVGTYEERMSNQSEMIAEMKIEVAKNLELSNTRTEQSRQSREELKDYMSEKFAEMVDRIDALRKELSDQINFRLSERGGND